jgi:hypothetical protein
MIRTQIQLTEGQMEALRQVSQREKLSIAEIIRRALDETLAASAPVSRAELAQRAAEVAGRFASGHSDVSAEHDRHLAEAFR